jgi:hypothetical protein
VARRNAHIAAQSAARVTVNEAVQAGGFIDPLELVRLVVPRAAIPRALVYEVPGLFHHSLSS